MAKKNPAAVALGRLVSKGLTAKQRSERARKAVRARWGRKAPPPTDPKHPNRWYQLVALDFDPNHPEVLAWSRDKAELLEQMRNEDRPTIILDVEYNPGRFTIQREFAPDADAQVKALHVASDAGKGGRS